MTNAVELRETLDHCRPDGYPPELRPLFDAARNIALPILEADPELVERIGILILEGILGDGDLNELARQVLAAISTPTPVESE